MTVIDDIYSELSIEKPENFEKTIQFLKDHPKWRDIIGEPLIIGHNCGYKEPNLGPIYSQNATENCILYANYLEIDIEKRIRKDKWYYYHAGKKGKMISEDDDRRNGIELKSFLDEFKHAKEKNEKNTCGLFFDIKGHIDSYKLINELMNIIFNKDYSDIFKRTPLMFFTGRGIVKPPVYEDSTRFLIKWFYERRNEIENKYGKDLVLSIVTREVEIDELLEGGEDTDSVLTEDEKKWFKEMQNKDKIIWSFNPHVAFIKSYDFTYIFQENIWFFTWMSDPLSITDKPWRWDKICHSIARMKVKIYNDKKFERPWNWGIITYRPKKFKSEFLKISDKPHKIAEYLLRNTAPKYKSDEEIVKLSTLI